ncbi:MAG: Lrp/AsnC family transcriptional regulator [Trichococcus flocculiformis]
MDKIDKQILNILQTNARASLKEIGEATFLSSPAISARIAQLELNGIITDYGAHVNLQALGYNIKAFINLEVDPKQKPVFYPFVEGIPNVLECNCVTGEFSMLLKVAFPTTKELDTFIGELQQFGKTYTQIVFSTSVGPRGIHFEDQ